jgi:hypothetical protein
MSVCLEEVLCLSRSWALLLLLMVLLLLPMVLLLPQSHLQSTSPQSWPVNRLMAEGVALFNLAAAADGGVFRDVLIKFFVPSRPLPFHTFSQV